MLMSRRPVPAVLAVALLLGACSAVPASTAGIPSRTPSPEATVSSAPSASPARSASLVSALVGQWELDRTCSALVAALMTAKLTDLFSLSLPEVLMGSVNGELPTNFDPAHPCADALPPTAHSHTFWPNGTFNSYDENGNEVDRQSYRLLDAHTFTMGDVVPMTWHFTVTGDTISFEPIIPSNCTSSDCRWSLSWAFHVAFPGQTWKRVTSGAHVP